MPEGKAVSTPQLALPLKRRGKPIARLPDPLEHVLQIQVVSLLHWSAAPGWIAFHPANGELRDKRTAAKLRAMGVKPGVPDLVLVSPDGRFHALELKRGKAPLRPEQRDFHAHAADHGWPVAVANSFDRAEAVLREWGALRPPPRSSR